MDRVGGLIGRSYRLFRYSGHPEADRVVIVIGSAFEVLDETAAWLNGHGEKVGVLHVTLYRPWDAERFRAALPPTVKRIAVLDRTKEPGGPGEPLYLDVLTSFAEALAAVRISSMPIIVGGRYGLSSKDFDPAMARTVFDELKKPEPKRGFTIGITDDVSHTSLAVDASFDIEPPDVVRALFFGLGADAPSARTRTRRRFWPRTRTAMRRATSSTTRRSPALTRSRTCGSARGRSARRIC